MVNFVLMPWEWKISVFTSACFSVCKRSLQFKSNNQKWKPICFALRVLMQNLPLSSCFFSEQHNHGELWVNAPKANKLYLHFWLLNHWNCHDLRQPWSNQQWWWSIIAWDRCVDAMPKQLPVLVPSLIFSAGGLWGSVQHASQIFPT